VTDGPTIVRFPTGSVAPDTPAVRRIGPVDVLVESDRRDVLLVAVGAFGGVGVEAATRMAEHGYGVTVVDPRWVRPVPAELVDLARRHRLVVTVEDGVRTGGFGDALARALREAGVTVPLRDLGVPADWHAHGSRTQILADLGLTAQDVARDVTGWISSLDEAEPVPLQVVDRVVPAERSAVPAERTAVPAKRSAVPAERSAVPAKRSAVPAERSAGLPAEGEPPSGR
jgi:1-deoxy-D-xylulose-5-phosphate synthase